MRNHFTKAAILVAMLVSVGCGSKLPPNDPKAQPLLSAPGTKPSQVTSQNVTDAKKAVEASPEEEKIRDEARAIAAKKARDEAKREIAKADTKEMAEARKELQKKADGIRKTQQALANALVKANISPACQGSVTVNPSAVDFWRGEDSTTILVVNESGGPVDVRTAFRGLGTLVGNLPAKCSATIGFTRHQFSEPNFMSIVLTAIPLSGDGKIFSQDFTTSLSYTYGGYGQMQSYTWKIR